MSLLNKDYIRSCLNHSAEWAESHGSDHGDYLGAGLFYYSLAYMLQARMCVCIGSGGGFVPRIMKQAQRDLALKNARTVLIDANTGDFGRPCWLPADSYFRTAFPDIEILCAESHAIACGPARDWQIDYLHIDGDHTHDGSLQDFHDYKSLITSNGIITFHDTKGSDLPCTRTLNDIRAEGHEVVDFPAIGAGFALVRLKR